MDPIGSLNTSSNNSLNVDEPLVSIVVITYNSAKYVLETLDSAKAQTFQNIELIISDDCSTDNTLSICKAWIEKNSRRFIRVKLLTLEKNRGISANCNSGVDDAKGEWIKLIAGDDILLPNCIEDNICFIKNNDQIEVLFSGVEFFGDSTLRDLEMDKGSIPAFFQKSALQQFELLLIKNRVLAPSAFLKKQIINELGGYDERIKNLEDRPFWIKATKAGFKLNYMPITTVKYRVHSESINFNYSSDLLHNELIHVFYLYQLPNISLRNFLNIWHTFLSLQTLKSKNYRVLKLFSPIWFCQKISMILKLKAF